MLFAMIGIDKIPEGLERRKQVRREHLQYLSTLGDKVKFAGPFTTEDGSQPTGSLIIYDVETIEEVREIVAKDPYTDVEVFETVDIRPWKWLFGGK